MTAGTKTNFEIGSMAGWICPTHSVELIELDGLLSCETGHSFKVRNGIPRFVPSETYADSFGAQWNKYRVTQLDSHSGTNITERRLRRCIGDDLWSSLAGKKVLECGCGAGRFTEILLAQGAVVTSCDLSNAVDANQTSFPQSAQHLIMQADILSLPLKPEQFDIVFCLGVLQYTADPEAAIESIYQQVKPGGWLVIDCYSPNLSWYTKSAPLVRYYLRRLPPEKGVRWTEKLVDTFLPFHKAVRKFRPAQMLLSRVSPVSCYYSSFPNLNEKQHREWAMLDTHNSLTGWYRHTRSRGQITTELAKLGLEEVWCSYGGNGVEARGRRPAL